MTITRLPPPRPRPAPDPLRDDLHGRRSRLAELTARLVRLYGELAGEPEAADRAGLNRGIDAVLAEAYALAGEIAALEQRLGIRPAGPLPAPADLGLAALVQGAVDRRLGHLMAGIDYVVGPAPTGIRPLPPAPFRDAS